MDPVESTYFMHSDECDRLVSESDLDFTEYVGKLDGIHEKLSILGGAIKCGNLELVDHITKRCQKELLNKPCHVFLAGKIPPLMEYILTLSGMTDLLPGVTDFNIIPHNPKEMFETLLKNGADANQAWLNNRGAVVMTPLSVASRHENADAIELLIKHGANFKNLPDMIFKQLSSIWDEAKIAAACNEICFKRWAMFRFVDQLPPEVRKIILAELHEHVSNIFVKK